MSCFRPIWRQWFAAATLGAALAVGAPATAQDLDDEAEEQPQQQQDFMVAPENFDQWVYGNRNAVGARNRLETQLSLRVEEIVRITGASDGQKKKLLLAGRGDMKRLFDRVEVVRKKFDLVRNDQQKFNEIWQDIQPLQLSFASGPFGVGSLFERSVRTTLKDDQAEAWEKSDRERRGYRYRAKVTLIVAMLDRVAALRAEQRRQLTDLVLSDTRPPRRFGQYDYYVVMVQMGKLPEEKLKAVLDTPQFKIIQQHLNQMRGIEQFLKQNGYLPEEGPVEGVVGATGATATP